MPASVLSLSGWRDSNPRVPDWRSGALPLGHGRIRTAGPVPADLFEPRVGIEPTSPVYGTGALPLSYRGASFRQAAEVSIPTRPVLETGLLAGARPMSFRSSCVSCVGAKKCERPGPFRNPASRGARGSVFLRAGRCRIEARGCTADRVQGREAFFATLRIHGSPKGHAVCGPQPGLLYEALHGVPRIAPLNGQVSPKSCGPKMERPGSFRSPASRELSERLLSGRAGRHRGRDRRAGVPGSRRRCARHTLRASSARSSRGTALWTTGSLRPSSIWPDSTANSRENQECFRELAITCEWPMNFNLSARRDRGKGPRAAARESSAVWWAETT